MVQSLSERDARVIWHPYTQHKNLDLPIPIVSGKGVLLFDEKGNSYIDAISSWWVNLHGHGNAFIAEKIYQQALALEHVIFTSFTHEPAVQLAEELLSLLPGNQSRIFYSDNGSTAVEVALKMAIQFWRNKGVNQRRKILALENAYHGDTFGAMSVSGRGLFTDSFRELLFDPIFLETPSPDNLDQLKARITSEAGQIAAFIYEPLLQAAGGMRMYDPGSMNELLRFVHEENILCIADEVLTGFGRTGTLFASEQLSVNPDLICLSKGITGGAMALGATSCSAEIFSAFLSEDRKRTFFHGHSYTANPLACAAGIASLQLLKEKTGQDQRSIIQQQHKNFMQEELLSKDFGFFHNPRVLGTVFAMEVNSGVSGYQNEVGIQIMKKGLKEGIYIRPLGNTVYIMPPYCISPDDLRKIYDFILNLDSV